jgi:hypothetical protein
VFDEFGRELQKMMQKKKQNQTASISEEMFRSSRSINRLIRSSRSFNSSHGDGSHRYQQQQQQQQQRCSSTSASASSVKASAWTKALLTSSAIGVGAAFLLMSNDENNDRRFAHAAELHLASVSSATAEDKLPIYSRAQVREHNSVEKRIWVTFGDKVGCVFLQSMLSFSHSLFLPFVSDKIRSMM